MKLVLRTFVFLLLCATNGSTLLSPKVFSYGSEDLASGLVKVNNHLFHTRSICWFIFHWEVLSCSLWPRTKVKQKSLSWSYQDILKTNRSPAAISTAHSDDKYGSTVFVYIFLS